MLKRAWCLAIAIGLIVAATDSWSQPTPQQPQSPALESQPIPQTGQSHRTPEPNRDGADEKQRAQNFSPALQMIERAIRDAIPKEDKEGNDRKEKREVADLEAQQDMALWAKRMFWATVGSVILTGCGLILIGATLHHTRRAADYAKDMVVEARKTTDAALLTVTESRRAADAAADAVGAERAWITLLRYDSGLATDVTVGDVKHVKAFIISLTLQNSGRSPALNANLYIEYRIIGADAEIPVFAQSRSDELRSTMLGPGQTGNTSWVFVPWNEVDQIMTHRKQMLIYCVASYYTIFNPKVERLSEFCLRVELNGLTQDRDGALVPNVAVTAIGPQNTAT